MKISGFTMVRNAGKLYFPIRASIESLLPIVDEFIVALGKGDDDDDTLAQIEAIGSPKIKIYHRVWDESLFTGGEIFRTETTFALNQCRGDWCIYLQADEVMHEDDLPKIVQTCEKYAHDNEVQGLLVNYFHFYGDYRHRLVSHSICANEIRIIKNGIGAESYRDAISFRIAGQKMKVAETDINIYHYGWVRPPAVMTRKRNLQHDMHHGKEAAAHYTKDLYQYGPLGRMDKFEGTHPAVMKDWIAKFDWSADLDYGSEMKPLNRPKFKHERIKQRIMSFIEKNLLGGKQIFAYRNWILVRKRYTNPT